MFEFMNLFCIVYVKTFTLILDGIIIFDLLDFAILYICDNNVHHKYV
jgi:hypothetical protein